MPLRNASIQKTHPILCIRRAMSVLPEPATKPILQRASPEALSDCHVHAAMEKQPISYPYPLHLCSTFNYKASPAFACTYTAHYLCLTDTNVIKQRKCRKACPGTRTAFYAIGYIMSLGTVPHGFTDHLRQKVRFKAHGSCADTLTASPAQLFPPSSDPFTPLSQ